MASQGFVTINVRGDRQYVQRLKIVAAQRGQTMADMIRIALDKEYGTEMATESFVGKRGTRKHRS